MGMKESPPAATVPPLLLRNLISSLLFFAANSLLSLAQKYQLLETFRFAFLFFLRFLPSSLLQCILLLPPTKTPREPRNAWAIGRALSQLLSIVNDIPVSSRKYEVVRSLAERVIEENNTEEEGSGAHALRRVNQDVLASAFARTLGRLETAARCGEGDCGVNRVLRAVGWKGGEVNRTGVSAEKLAGELLWLADKMAACSCGNEAVRMWAAARDLGWLALSAEPRLQASLFKLAAFLFKEAKDMKLEGSKMEVKLKMLQSWLPLLCRASNGTDAPVLSIRERTELERVLEEIIQGLEQEEWQEQVLSLWLHHFTHCSSSDWPNLHACYARWCSASRKQLLLQ